MLHVIIYIHRSGSNSLSFSLSEKLSLPSLGEVMYKCRGSDNINFKNHFDNFILSTKGNDFIVKFHVQDLKRLHDICPQSLETFLDSDLKFYYPIRLNYKYQITSQMIAANTQQWLRTRNTTEKIVLNDSDIPLYFSQLSDSLRIQGELYRKFPGEVVLLKEDDNPYPKYNVRFTGLKTFLKKEIFPELDVLSMFYSDTSEYFKF